MTTAISIHGLIISWLFRCCCYRIVFIIGSWKL